MVRFAKLIISHSFHSIQCKLVLLYILNILDIFFTLFLISTGYLREANILMSYIVNKPVLALLIKIILPGLLIIILKKRIAAANTKQLQITNLIVCIAVLCYTLIIICHILYFILLSNQGLVKLCIFMG